MGRARSAVRPFYLPIRRALVIVSVAVCLYIVVGSFTDANWWYGMLWDGTNRVEYAKAGFVWLFDNAFWLAFSIVIAIFVLAVLGRIYKGRVYKLLDLAPWVVIFCFWLLVAADALVLRHTQADRYLGWMPPDEYEKVIDSHIAPPGIVVPIYFHYVDSDRVERLYNQLQPELQIKERDVAGRQSLTAGAAVGLSDNKADVQVGSEDSTRATYGRSPESVDRKCVSVMKYVEDTWPGNYFDGLLRWMIRADVLRAEQLARIRVDPQTLTPIQPLDGNEDKQKAKRDFEESVHQIFAQLQYVRGYVFVEGDFEKTSSRNGVILVQQFTNVPQKCWFRVFLTSNVAQNLPKGQPLKLTVFGEVTKPLSNDGFVDVAPIAIY